ncbi:RNAdirected DNA polymerase from mobile element jockeylike [Caligus rogercresseyi]|uniref:RNAdirected DNA polymerase from mobile element jockeylike n=1 Tax=Caligus rogercresseyi TaxID=217165 RepID=A0A7T8JUB5_CALRO|nr:RNAdirected DNA polymerase from mobile element jockeylike [Caligus rogercresseyi]
MKTSGNPNDSISLKTKESQGVKCLCEIQEENRETSTFTLGLFYHSLDRHDNIHRLPPVPETELGVRKYLFENRLQPLC